MAHYKISSDALTDIANSIREKTNISEPIKPSEMAGAISDIKVSSFKESQTYSQVNPVVNAFLSEVAYDSSDYSTSQIESYAGQSTAYRKDQPSGLDISVSSGEIHISDNSSNHNFSETVNSGTYTICNIAPSENGGYYFLSTNGELNTGGKIIPTGYLRMIKCPAACNVRDLGGWNCDGGTIKYGLLFRGGEVSASDIPVLVDFIGIKHDVNLRGKQEVTWTTSPLGSNVRFHIYDTYAWYSISNPTLIKSIITDIFDAVVHGEPVYFHCSAGADRTGTIAFIIEALLGMSQSDMDKDYELTCFYTGVESDNNARRRNEAEWTGLVNSFSNYDGETIRDKVVSYLVSIGIDIDNINKFRRKMINGYPDDLVISEETIKNILINDFVYNGTNYNAIGYEDGVRLSTANGTTKEANGRVTTGYIPVMKGDIIRIKGLTYATSIDGTVSIVQYNSDKTFMLAAYLHTDVPTPIAGFECSFDNDNKMLTISVGDITNSFIKLTGIGTTGKSCFVTINQKIPDKLTHINQIINSIDEEGNVVGLLKDKRYNSSDTLVDASGIDCCGFIPIKTGDIVSFTNMSFGGNGSGSYYCRVYDSNKNLLAAFSPYDLKTANYPDTRGTHTVDIKYDSNNNISQFTVGTMTNGTIAYIRLSWTPIVNATAIITVNEFMN